MATPARVIQLKCPGCAASHWVFDSDYRGMGGEFVPFEQREYRSPHCGVTGTGYQVEQNRRLDSGFNFATFNVTACSP